MASVFAPESWGSVLYKFERDLQNHLYRLDGSCPKLAGDAVASVVASLAISMLVPTNCTRPNEPETRASSGNPDWLTAELTGLCDDLMELASLEICAQEAAVEALGMPADDWHQKTERVRVTQLAFIELAEICLQIGQTVAEVARLSLLISENYGANQSFDAGVAALLADAAARSAALTIERRLFCIEDDEFVRSTWMKMQAIVSETRGLLETTLTAIGDDVPPRFRYQW